MKRYHNSIKQRRIMDSVARHIKYNDGIKDLVGKIKSKISEIVTQIKDIPRGDKIKSLLLAILASISTIMAAANIRVIIEESRKLIGYNKALKQYASLTGDTTEDPLGKAIVSERKMTIISSSLKVITTLLIAFNAAVGAKLAIAKKQVQEGEDESRVVAEVMTR